MAVINRIITGALLVGSALGFNSCQGDSQRLAESRQGVVKELLADRPAREYNQAVAGWRDNLSASADAQSTIDSIAYRQVFDGTVAAQDSTKVKEFNTIAGKMRVGNYETFNSAFVDLDNKMIDMDITKRNLDANAKEYKAYRTCHPRIFGSSTYFENYEKVLAVRQFKADSMAYTKFFKENNLVTPEVAQKLEKVAKKVKLKP